MSPVTEFGFVRLLMLLFFKFVMGGWVVGEIE